MQINMSVALPERSWPPHKVLLVMPDLQIFIISPPDNLIMQRSRIHFAPLRKPARDALSLIISLHSRLPFISQPELHQSCSSLPSPPQPPVLQALKRPCSFCLGLACVYKDPQKGGGDGKEHLWQITPPPSSPERQCLHTVNFLHLLSHPVV